MDLRHYIGKQIDPHLVCDYNYKYYPNHGNAYSNPLIILSIQRNGGTPNMPDYSVMINLKNGCKISSIYRLKEVWKAGYRTAKFPVDVETEAERILDSILTDKDNADVETVAQVLREMSDF